MKIGRVVNFFIKGQKNYVFIIITQGWRERRPNHQNLRGDQPITNVIKMAHFWKTASVEWGHP
jgi:hypothetical protein